MAKSSLSLEERRAIRDRLDRFRKKRYRNRQAMIKDAGVPHSTAAGWFAPNPRTPDVVSLVRIATAKNLNLNWVLLDEGNELRGVESEREVWPLLRQTLVEELVSHGAPRADAERLVPLPEKLFDFLLFRLVEGWEQARNRKLTGRPPGIARALDRLLSGLHDPPGAWPPRRRLF